MLDNDDNILSILISSINGDLTIQTLDESKQDVIGNRQGLSFYDIMTANKIYKCDELCSGRNNCPSDSYRGKDCECYCKDTTGNGPSTICRNGGSGSRTTRRPVTRAPKTTTTERPTTELCRDKNNHCPYWAESPKKYCQRLDYMRMLCKKSCGFCDGDVVQMRCTNKHKLCYFWKRIGICTREPYINYMEDNCKKACGYCIPSKDEKDDHFGDGPEDGIGNEAESKGGEAGAITHGFNLALLASALVAYVCHQLRY